MNLQSLVVVAFRLIALYYLLFSATQFMGGFILLTHPRPPAAILSSGSEMIFSGMFWFGCAALLWICALRIARRVTRGVSRDISFGAMSLVDCYSIAFMSVGLFFIVSQLPHILNRICYLFIVAVFYSGSWQIDVKTGYAVSEEVIHFFAGILLFVFGRKLAVILAQKHAKVPSPVAADNEKHVSEN